MSNETQSMILRRVARNAAHESDASTLERIAAQLDSDAKRYADSMKLQDIGKGAYDSVVEMVAALECDYDRLEELREMKREQTQDDAQSFEEEYAEELAELEEAAGECESREEAEQRIHEDPLSVEVRGDWSTLDVGADVRGEPVEFNILLGTGGPATRIIGELDEHGEPTRARLQVQDWFLPWTDYVQGDSETLLTYCRCFYFGEG